MFAEHPLAGSSSVGEHCINALAIDPLPWLQTQHLSPSNLASMDVGEKGREQRHAGLELFRVHHGGLVHEMAVWVGHSVLHQHL